MIKGLAITSFFLFFRSKVGPPASCGRLDDRLDSFRARFQPSSSSQPVRYLSGLQASLVAVLQELKESISVASSFDEQRWHQEFPRLLE